MTNLILWICLLIVGLWAGWMELASWHTVVTAAVSSGIFAALISLFGEEA